MELSYLTLLRVTFAIFVASAMLWLANSLTQVKRESYASLTEKADALSHRIMPLRGDEDLIYYVYVGKQAYIQDRPAGCPAGLILRAGGCYILSRETLTP